MSARESARDASHNGVMSQRASEPAIITAAMPIPPVNRSSASDAAPKAEVPSIARSAPVRAASIGLI